MYSSEVIFKAKWLVLLSLLVLHKDEEWILNESANSIGIYLNYINDKSILSEILNELFSYGFEADTLEHVRNNIKVQEIAALFEIYFQIVCGDANSIKDSLTTYLKENYDTLNDTQLNHFVNKVKSAAEIFNQINLDDIIDEVASTRVTERGGRSDDKRSEAAMEDRKKNGYF